MERNERAARANHKTNSSKCSQTKPSSKQTFVIRHELISLRPLASSTSPALQTRSSSPTSWCGRRSIPIAYITSRIFDCVPNPTSRALYGAIEELERLQAARKAREDSASSTDAEAAPPSSESNGGEVGKQLGNNPGADTTRRRFKKTLSRGLRSHRGWRGFTTPARAAKKSDFAKKGFCAPEGERYGLTLFS